MVTIYVIFATTMTTMLISTGRPYYWPLLLFGFINELKPITYNSNYETYSFMQINSSLYLF